MQRAKLSGIFCFLALLMALGVLSYIYQATKGLRVTGLREPVVWGIYVVNFTFCVGLAAGILIVLTIVSGLDAIRATEKFILSVTAFVSLAMAGAFVIVDLGRADRLYYLIIYPQLNSPLFWDFVAVTILTVVTTGFCFVTLRQLYLKAVLSDSASVLEKYVYKLVTAKRDFTTSKSLRKILRALILLLVTGAYLVTTEVFTDMKARPQWRSPVLGLVFLISGIVSGMSAFILVKSFCRQPLERKDRTMFNPEQKILLFLLMADLTAMLTKHCIERDNPLISKVYSLFPFSLLFFLAIGNIIPILLMLLCKVNRLRLYRLVPTLALVGVLLKRAELIIPAYFSRWLPFAPEVSYRPTFPEISIVLGVYGTAAMVLMVVFSGCYEGLVRQCE